MPRYSSHVFLRWYVALRVQSQYSPQSAASGSFAAIACQPLSDWKSHQAAFLKSVLFLLITTIWILGYIFYGLAFSVAWDSNRISIVANTGIFWLFFHRWSALRGFWVVYLSLWTCPWPGALVNAGASSSADTTYPKSSCRCLRWDHLHQWVQDKVAGRFVSVNMYNYILYIPCPQNQISQYSPIRETAVDAQVQESPSQVSVQASVWMWNGHRIQAACRMGGVFKDVSSGFTSISFCGAKRPYIDIQEFCHEQVLCPNVCKSIPWSCFTNEVDTRQLLSCPRICGFAPTYWWMYAPPCTLLSDLTANSVNLIMTLKVLWGSSTRGWYGCSASGKTGDCSDAAKISEQNTSDWLLWKVSYFVSVISGLRSCLIVHRVLGVRSQCAVREGQR